MNKKRLLMMVTAMVLVGALAIGMTLAYFTDTTDVATNAFAMGDIDVDLDEDGDGDENEDPEDEGQDYKELLPGDLVWKEPILTVNGGSVDCYAFLQVAGVDALEALGFGVGVAQWDAGGKLDKDSFENQFNLENWKKVSDGEGKDGIYMWVDQNGNALKVAKDEDAQALIPTIFNCVQVNEDKTLDQDEATDMDLETLALTKIVIKGAAVQWASVDEELAIVEAGKLFPAE